MRRESNSPEFYNFFVYSSSCNSLFFGLLLSSFLSPFVNKYKMKAKCSENEAEKDIIIWNAIQKNCKILDYYCRLTWIATNCRSWLLRHQVKWEWQPNSTQQCAWQRDNVHDNATCAWQRGNVHDNATCAWQRDNVHDNATTCMTTRQCLQITKMCTPPSQNVVSAHKL